MKWILIFLFLPSVYGFGVTQLDDTFYVVGSEDETITVSGLVEESFFLKRGDIREVSVDTKQAGDVIFTSGMESISFFVSNPIVYDVDEKTEYMGVIIFNVIGLAGGLLLWKKKLF